jgi:hypothetical protein
LATSRHLRRRIHCAITRYSLLLEALAEGNA